VIEGVGVSGIEPEYVVWILTSLSGVVLAHNTKATPNSDACRLGRAETSWIGTLAALSRGVPATIDLIILLLLSCYNNFLIVLNRDVSKHFRKELSMILGLIIS